MRIKNEVQSLDILWNIFTFICNRQLRLGNASPSHLLLIEYPVLVVPEPSIGDEQSFGRELRCTQFIGELNQLMQLVFH